MQLNLGVKIRELRRREGQTQEALATALGVTSQAVSRWESGGSYPDMNLIPSIANYFNVTIDELFGYTSRRDRKIDTLWATVNEMLTLNNGKDNHLDECIALAREAMVEFPDNEKIMLCLASVLYQAGYARHGEHHLTDTNGYSVYDTERHRCYAEWREAITLYEKALPAIDDVPLQRRAVRELSQLYVSTGAYEKAQRLADAAPDLWGCRELLRICASDGKDQARACGKALLAVIRVCAELIVHALLVNQRHLTPAEKVDALQCALRLFSCICPDGNYGEHHAFIGKLHMLRSAFLWLNSRRDETFSVLDEALSYFRTYAELSQKGACRYTAPLIRLVSAGIPPQNASMTAELPEDWPWWNFPEAAAIKEEITSDPRWHAWAAKARA